MDFAVAIKKRRHDRDQDAAVERFTLAPMITSQSMAATSPSPKGWIPEFTLMRWG
jgi:hypothetical protein